MLSCLFALQSVNSAGTRSNGFVSAENMMTYTMCLDCKTQFTDPSGVFHRHWLHQKMGTVTLYPLLLLLSLLLLFGCFQGAISQFPEWLEEVEGSGKTSNNVRVMLFFSHQMKDSSTCSGYSSYGTTFFLVWALKPENISSFFIYECQWFVQFWCMSKLIKMFHCSWDRMASWTRFHRRHLLVRVSAPLHGRLYGAAPGAEERSLWRFELLLDRPQVPVQR